jgi:Universal stress protein family
MLPIRTILHPSDFSEGSKFAYSVAAALARDYGARIVVVHVAEPARAVGLSRIVSHRIAATSPTAEPQTTLAADNSSSFCHVCGRKYADPTKVSKPHRSHGRGCHSQVNLGVNQRRSIDFAMSVLGAGNCDGDWDLDIINFAKASRSCRLRVSALLKRGSGVSD